MALKNFFNLRGVHTGRFQKGGKVLTRKAKPSKGATKTQRRAAGLSRKQATATRAKRKSNAKKAALGAAAALAVAGAAYATHQRTGRNTAGVSVPKSTTGIQHGIRTPSISGVSLAARRDRKMAQKAAEATRIRRASLPTLTGTSAAVLNAANRQRRINGSSELARINAPSHATIAPAAGFSGGAKQKRARKQDEFDVLNGSADQSVLKGTKLTAEGAPNTGTLYIGINEKAGQNGRKKGVAPIGKTTNFNAPDGTPARKLNENGVAVPINWDPKKPDGPIHPGIVNVNAVREEMRQNSIQMTRVITGLRRNNADIDEIKRTMGPLVARQQYLQGQLAGVRARREQTDVQTQVLIGQKLGKDAVGQPSVYTFGDQSVKGQEAVRKMFQAPTFRPNGKISNTPAKVVQKRLLKNSQVLNTESGATGVSMSTMHSRHVDRVNRRVGAASNVFLGAKDAVSPNQRILLETITGKKFNNITARDVRPYQRFARVPIESYVNFIAPDEDDARIPRQDDGTGSRARGSGSQVRINGNGYGWEKPAGYKPRVKQTSKGRKYQAQKKDRKRKGAKKTAAKKKAASK